MHWGNISQPTLLLCINAAGGNLQDLSESCLRSKHHSKKQIKIPRKGAKYRTRHLAPTLNLSGAFLRVSVLDKSQRQSKFGSFSSLTSQTVTLSCSEERSLLQTSSNFLCHKVHHTLPRAMLWDR